MKRKDVIEKISDSTNYGNLGLFIGAGMSMAILNDSWDKIALSWQELIYKCAESFDIKLNKDFKTEGLSYPEIASEIAKIISEKKEIKYSFAMKELKEKISELTCWYPESEQRKKYNEILLKLDPSWIITTNYDLIIECLLTGKSLSLSPTDQLIAPKGLIPIYHLHGIRTNPDSIIISQEDYISLFRPNQYRQQKLSLSIKESTTLIIGYGLGDVNVLTAVDWTKNVYSNQKINYPHDIIQLLYCEKPKSFPYRDRNDILIIEFNDLESILNEITDSIEANKKSITQENIQINKLNEILSDPKEKNVNQFVDISELRIELLELIAKKGVNLISGFLELFSKSIDETWNRSKPNGAFEAYNENLTILIDVLQYIKLEDLPPALLESVAYNLNRLSSYIGDYKGQSQSAYRTWKNRKKDIPIETQKELLNISITREYIKLKKLLK